MEDGGNCVGGCVREGNEREWGRGATDVNVPLDELKTIGLGDEFAVEGRGCAGHDCGGGGEEVEVVEQGCCCCLHVEKVQLCVGRAIGVGLWKRGISVVHMQIQDVDKTLALDEESCGWICQEDPFHDRTN